MAGLPLSGHVWSAVLWKSERVFTLRSQTSTLMADQEEKDRAEAAGLRGESDSILSDSEESAAHEKGAAKREAMEDANDSDDD